MTPLSSDPIRPRSEDGRRGYMDGWEAAIVMASEKDLETARVHLRLMREAQEQIKARDEGEQA